MKRCRKQKRITGVVGIRKTGYFLRNSSCQEQGKPGFVNDGKGYADRWVYSIEAPAGVAGKD